MTEIALVVAVSRNGVIGRDGGLPWHISSDLKRFKAITMGKPIVMGRKTWESLPRRPLPGRQNIVISRAANYPAPGATVVGDVQSALDVARQGTASEICVIGGGEIFALVLPLATRIYLSEVQIDVTGDTYFPSLPATEWREVSSEVVEPETPDSSGYIFRVLERV